MSHACVEPERFPALYVLSSKSDNNAAFLFSGNLFKVNEESLKEKTLALLSQNYPSAHLASVQKSNMLSFILDIVLSITK